MKTPFQRILAYNLLLLMGIAGLLRLLIHKEYTNQMSGYALLMVLAIVTMIVANLAGAALTRSSTQRKAYLLAALLTPLIGLGTCAVGVRTIPRTTEWTPPEQRDNR